VVGDDLVVLSSNFDQRYNAGRVHLYDLPKLVAKLPAEGAEVLFDEELQSALNATLRIDQFASDVVRAQDGQGQDWLLIASRGRNQLTVLDYAPGAVTCTAPSEQPSRFDCAESHGLNTRSQDPFSLVVMDSGTQSVAAYISHLRSVRNQDDQLYRQSITRVPLQSYQDSEPTVERYTFLDYGGVTGMTFVPAGYLGIPATDLRRRGTLVAVERNRTPTMTLRGFTVRTDGGTVEQTHSLDLGATINAGASRGLVFDAQRERLYVSLRFQENADSFNAAIATVDVRGDTFQVIGLTEVGEELGQPILHQVPGGPRLLYIPDIRLNTIWVMDVSTDVPVVAHRVESVGLRDFSGTSAQVPLLASPVDMAFYTSGARTFAFVSNFSDSTLAVLDVSATDPRKHRVVARLGRDIDAEGEKEGP